MPPLWLTRSKCEGPPTLAQYPTADDAMRRLAPPRGVQHLCTSNEHIDSYRAKSTYNVTSNKASPTKAYCWANIGFGNFSGGFGNSQALGFGNLPSLGFGNFSVGFGNFQALGFGNSLPLGFGNSQALEFGFGNLPIPPDSETSASDSETSRPSDSETCLSPRIRKLQRRIRKLPGARIWKLAFPPGFGNLNVGFGNFQALGFGNFVTDKLHHR